MGKKKDSISSNFENLKAQMIKKREIAEQVSNKDETRLAIDNTKDTEENNNTCKNVYKDVYTNTDVNTINVENNNTNKFVIKKAVKEELPKRITYYLKPSTIGKIDKLSKKASMGKSEFVQKILESVLDNLEIE